MNAIKNQICLFLVFFVIALAPVKGQTLKSWVAAADTAFQDKDYYSAFHYYDAALKYDSTLAKALYFKGRAAFAFHNYSDAMSSFDRLLDYDSTNTYPDATFWMARVYQTTGQFKEAKEYFEGFLTNPGKSEEAIIKQARKGVEDTQWALGADLRDKDLQKPVNLGPQINSGDSDFGGLFKDGTLYYSSFRFPFEKDKRKPPRNLIQLMQMTPDSAIGTLLPGPFNSAEKHTAYTTFSLDEKRMYFCLCEYVNTAEIRCDIYQSQQDPSGIWQTPTPLSVNVPGKTTTQPAIGRDPQTGKEVLYFASDRAEGLGALDLWYGPIDDYGDVKEAINLKSLNTIYNDATPFYHDLSRNLYFSSEGHQTFGGYDIQETYFNQGAWQSPTNMGPEVNSSYSELHYTLNENGDLGVLDSDRPGSILFDRDAEVCCYDLYKVDLDTKIDLEVYTFNALDSTPLFGVDVSLDRLDLTGLMVDKETTYSDFDNIRDRVVKRDSQRSPETHRYIFELDRQYMYSLLGEKPIFLPDSQLVNLIGLDRKQKTIRKDLYLMPEEINLRILTLDSLDGSDLLSATVEIIEVRAPFDSVSIFLETNDLSNVFEKKISSNYNYFLKASKPTYNSQDYFLEITPELIAEVGRDITVEIPLGQDPVRLLPLALYFDNAIPYNRNYSPTTTDNFEVLSEAYAEREKEFYNQFSTLLTEDQKFEVERYYQDFFAREVVEGTENLKKFAAVLSAYLKKGNSLSIQVKGYASPIAGSRYNDMLSRRRIKSIENFFSEYNDGALKPYIENRQLQIEEAAFGDQRAGKDVPPRIERLLSDLGNLGNLAISNSRDRRISVYGLAACIERRVEIVEVKRGTQNNNPNEQ